MFMIFHQNSLDSQALPITQFRCAPWGEAFYRGYKYIRRVYGVEINGDYVDDSQINDLGYIQK